MGRVLSVAKKSVGGFLLFGEVHSFLWLMIYDFALHPEARVMYMKGWPARGRKIFRSWKKTEYIGIETSGIFQNIWNKKWSGKCENFFKKWERMEGFVATFHALPIPICICYLSHVRIGLWMINGDHQWRPPIYRPPGVHNNPPPNFTIFGDQKQALVHTSFEDPPYQADQPNLDLQPSPWGREKKDAGDDFLGRRASQKLILDNLYETDHHQKCCFLNKFCFINWQCFKWMCVPQFIPTGFQQITIEN